MKPYYKTKLGKLYHGDCLEIMPQFEKVDLILTDPPYGVRRDEKWDDSDYFLKHHKRWLDWCILQARCVLWFCADKMLPTILNAGKDEFHRILIWDKPEGSQFAGAMHSNVWYSIEPILVFGNPPKTDKKKKYGYASFKSRTIPKKTFNHPTSKPEWLMYELAYFYTLEGDVVEDPFLAKEAQE